MKRFAFTGLLSALLTVAISHAAGANTVYPINVTITGPNPTGNPAQSDTVSGSITTDGVIGTLASGDIVSWNLVLTDQLNAADDFTLLPGNSTIVEDTGSALSATATGLYFNYSGHGEFLIQANSPGAFSGYHYFCFSTGGACLAGESIVPYYINTDGVVLTGSSAPVGSQPLGPSSAAPEPVSLALTGGGLALALGLAMRRKFCRI